MKLLFLQVLVLLFWTHSASSESSGLWCLEGIVTAVQEFVFQSLDPTDYYAGLCHNNLSVVSIWANAKLYCSIDEITAGQTNYESICMEYGHMHMIPYNTVQPLLTDEFIASLPTVSYKDIDTRKAWNTSIILDPSLEQMGFRTVSVFDIEESTHKRYGWFVYGFWGTIILIGFLNRALRAVARRYDNTDTSNSQFPNKTTQSFKFATALYQWVYKHLTLPATFGTYHQQLFWWCKIPTLLTAIVVSCYWILSLVLCSVSYNTFSPNLYYTKPEQKWRYIADRTGRFAYANLPFLWAFSGRNNIFIWVTGWQYATFNIFHRHIARVATIQAIVHAASYTALELLEGEFTSESKEKYWIMGIVAVISMCLLLGFSSIFLRRHAYEVFLVIHIGLAVLTIVGLFYHTDIFNGEFNPYLWPPVAMWLFDRSVRLVRQCWCNLDMTSSYGISNTTATAYYDNATDIIRLEVFPGSNRLNPSAGQHYYLYVPFRWRGWENHPFTLAAWSTKSHVESEASTPTEAEMETKAVFPELSKMALNKEIDTGQKETSRRRTFTFLVRPNHGWTKTLRDQCMAKSQSAVSLKLLLEGPYGEPCPLYTYTRVIFVVGGSGITAALPYLQDHIERKNTKTRGISFIWTTKQAAMIHNLASNELTPYLRRDDIELSFHATLTTAEANHTFRNEVDVDGHDGLYPRITFGRPNLKKCVSDVVRAIESSPDGNIAVFACGPAEMLDEIRNAVHHALKNSATEIEYFEESFGW